MIGLKKCVNLQTKNMNIKKIIFLAVISTSFWGVRAKGYYCLLEKEKTWKCGYYNALDTLYIDYQLNGDTLIGGKAYMKVTNSTAFLREENKRIFIMDELRFGNKEEYLLYDYGMDEGDIYMFSESAPKYVVAKTDTIEVKGALLKRLWFVEKKHDHQSENALVNIAFYWVESIGSQKGLLHVFDGNETIGRIPFIDSCYKSGKLIFTYKNFGDPSVTDGIKPTTIVAAKPRKDGHIYDLQGRRMAENQPLQPGIYVKDGRKFVVK